MPRKDSSVITRKKASATVSKRKNASNSASKKASAQGPSRKLKASTSTLNKPRKKTSTSTAKSYRNKTSITPRKTTVRKRLKDDEPSTQETAASESEHGDEPESEDEHDDDDDHQDGDEDEDEPSTQVEAAAATAEFLKSVNTSMESRHQAKRRKLENQHQAAVEKIEKGIRDGSRKQAREFAKYRNDKLTRLEELVKQRAAIEAKIETSVQKMEGAYDAMYYEFKKFLEEKIEMAEQADA